MAEREQLGDERLALLRARIDELDDQLLALISRRAATAHEIAAAKGPLEAGADRYRPEREAQVLRRLVAANPGPLPDESIGLLFRELMSACRALQQQLAVAYLGPEGTFTQAAAQKHFGQSVCTVPLAAIDEVFRAVESRECQYGVVPVENSIEGVVSHTLDSFVGSSLRICGEVELRIHHHLLSREPELARVVRVYAHQQALAQCRRWLDGRLGGVERIALSSNAEAARRCTGEPGSAAIAGAAAGALYGLGALASNIEDQPDNTTRFLVVGPRSAPPSGDDKTSLLFATPNRPGALYHVLSAFAEAGISMTRIESRPSRQGMWDYFFFVDVIGHADDPLVAEALQRFGQRTTMLKLLGSYPRAAN